MHTVAVLSGVVRQGRIYKAGEAGWADEVSSRLSSAIVDLCFSAEEGGYGSVS